MADKSWKVEVLAMGEARWASNMLRLETEEMAAGYGLDLAGRWFAVDRWRTVACDTAPTHRFVDGQVEAI